MSEYLNLMSLRFDHKGIPYPPGGVRDDGDQNYGFRNLRGDQNLDDIPELQDDLALRRLVATLNAPESGTFSVGCLSAHIEADEGHRFSGYVEFSMNSKLLIADASNYFPLFFHFGRQLHEHKFSVPVKFGWELQPAVFTDGDASGFTCTVFVNTAFASSKGVAQEHWRHSLRVLEEYLASWEPDAEDTIY